MNNSEVLKVKENLLSKLKGEKAFWSYDQDSITISNIQDDELIAQTMRYLDLPEIKQLFGIFSFRKIKKAWISRLIPEGKYLETLNRFFAWYYFKAKNPDSYIKSLYTRHLNSL
ncbi:MAG: hypothetical protein K2M93_09530 [Muribaculaceae bacterium]|nr:hypothetical protein [Muribaculaceae bacterium]